MNGKDITLIDQALANGTLTLPPVIAAELLGAAGDDSSGLRDEILLLDLLPVLDGYWHRTGAIRSLLRSHGRRARLGDALICQSCLDHDVALITRDADFRTYAELCGLKLA